jgi:hypothetical protein
VLLFTVTATASLEDLEGTLDKIWKRVTKPTTEDELVTVRRRVAAAGAAQWSGASGRARRAAAVAAGSVGWRTASEIEMTVLSVSPDQVNAALEPLTAWREILNTGSGVLPIVDVDAGAQKNR